MANNIDASFVQQFESEIHLAYQRMGTKLMNTTRKKSNVVGTSTTFQKLGELDVGSKARNQPVVLTDGVHAAVECTVADVYTSNMIDKLDELKIQHDERAANAQSIAGTMGRATDAVIVTALEAGAGASSGNSALAFTRDTVEEAYVYLGNNDVPDDGERYMPISPQQWAELMAEDAFSSADYVGYDQLVYGGMVAKRWWGFMIFSFSGLNATTNVRNAFAYHRSAVGFASGQDFELDVTWQGLYQAHLLVGTQSQGCVVIDDEGVFQIQTTEA